MAQVRQFDSGATRDTDEGKLDYEGFLSPEVLQRFAEYMHLNRIQSDGTLRDSDNWQKGIPKEAYVKSLMRHAMDVWLNHRGAIAREDMETALCAVMFNAMGLLYEVLKDNKNMTPGSVVPLPIPGSVVPLVSWEHCYNNTTAH